MYRWKPLSSASGIVTSFPLVEESEASICLAAPTPVASTILSRSATG
jgi:hypothetical protein